MAVCAVVDCQNSVVKNQLPNMSFHPFPPDDLRIGQWLVFCERNDGLNTKTAKICSLHFKKDDFENFMKYEMGFARKLKLKNDAVPTVHVKAKKSSVVQNKSPEPDATRLEFENLTKDVDDMKMKISNLQRENFILKIAEDDYKKQIKSLQTELTKSQYRNNNIEEKLKKIFSSGQIRKLKNESRIVWSQKDITDSIDLYAISHRAYKLLRKRQFPFPAVRTLLAHQKKGKELKEINDDIDSDDNIDNDDNIET